MSARWQATERDEAKLFPAESSISKMSHLIDAGLRLPPVVPNVTPPPTLLVPLDGGPAIQICNNLCRPAWSPDGRYLYLQISDKSGQTVNVRTAAIPIPPGKTLPHLPPEAVRDPAEWAKVPGVKMVDHTDIALGLDPSTYAYIKPSVHANLFRIPIQ